MAETTEPHRRARAETNARAARRYAATQELLAVTRLEHDGDRRARELALRLRDFDAREAQVVAQLRAAGFLRRRGQA